MDIIVLILLLASAFGALAVVLYFITQAVFVLPVKVLLVWRRRAAARNSLAIVKALEGPLPELTEEQQQRALAQIMSHTDDGFKAGPPVFDEWRRLTGHVSGQHRAPEIAAHDDLAFMQRVTDMWNTL